MRSTLEKFKSLCTSEAGYLALIILLPQVLQIQIQVVFAQQVVALQGVLVVYLNLQSAVRKLLICEGERLIEDHVFAASLQRLSFVRYRVQPTSETSLGQPRTFSQGLTSFLDDVFCFSLPICSNT